jgi:cytoskeletal protein RodZ
MSQIHFPGNELRERREVLGLSFADVHEMTHVPVSYLRALETSTFNDLPAPAYTAGFLRSYCDCLELAPERFVDLYEAAAIPQAKYFVARQSARGQELANRYRNAIAWCAVCAVVATMWFAWSAIFRIDERGRMDRGVQADELTREEMNQIDLSVPEAPLGTPSASR